MKTVIGILDYVEDFVADKKRDNYALHSIKQYVAVIKKFGKWLEESVGEIDAAEISENNIKDYILILRENNAKQTTIGFQVAALKNYFNFLIDQDIVSKNPARKIHIPKPDPHIEILTPDEIEKLLAIPNKRSDLGIRAIAIYYFLYDTGCRISELVKLDLEDINLESGQVRIQNSKSKANDWRAVELSPKTVNSIKRWLKVRTRFINTEKKALFVSLKGGRRLKTISIQVPFANDLKKAGLRKVGIHTLRHSSISHRLEKGAPIEYLSKKAGHKSIATTISYYVKFNQQYAKEIEDKFGVM
jgi:site-specific recombinase XerD